MFHIDPILNSVYEDYDPYKYLDDDMFVFEPVDIWHDERYSCRVEPSSHG